MVEVLLALALSSFIMMALMQAYQMLVRYIESAKNITSMTQRIALVTNLIERDFTVACMPQLFQRIQSNKEKGTDGSGNPDKDKAVEEKQEKQLSDEERKNNNEKRIEERKKCFFTEIDDSDFHKIKGKKVELLKSCNFITTHALEVYSESAPRWVRVRYELVKDKKSKKDSYTFVRKQTTDIYNTKMKISEVDANANSKEHPLIQHEVMRGVKGLFIEFSMIKNPEKNENGVQNTSAKKEEPEEIASFLWGENKKTAGQMPQRAHVYIDLWNEDFRESQIVELEIPILADGDPEAIMQQGLAQQGKQAQGETPAKNGSNISLASDAVKKNPGNLESNPQSGDQNNQANNKPQAPQGSPGAENVNDLLSILGGSGQDE